MSNVLIAAVNNDRFSRPEVTDQVAASGHLNFVYKVEGFWSDPVKVQLRRATVWNDDEGKSEVVWNAEVRSSAGGVDAEGVESALEAQVNCAHAMLDAVEVAKELTAKQSDLEQAFQAERERVKREQDAIAAKREAAMMDDPGFGLAEAGVLVGEMAAKAVEDKGNEHVFIALERAGKSETALSAVHNSGRTLFYFDGERMAKKDMVDYLANRSKENSHWLHA
ncbi:hypothetical protein [Neptuniibacter sp. QD37_11]|uniref:hypothetical protein n=1 Tax=Neptuniibacter sp. QD37_11 TaxID=3398209 RepID=UPI0039F532FE